MAMHGEDRSALGGLLHRALRPFRKFFQTESASGLILIAIAGVALIWANLSPEGYESLWDLSWSLGRPGFGLTLSIREWVNDGLMAFFFLLVGLEIKREIMIGELASFRRAALPLAAAAGGMAIPALTYSIFNLGTPGAHGWGIPMATDIAFALGVLALLGKRVAPGLRVFLAALAIVDDLGAVAVIAFFYTEGLSLGALGIGVGVFIILLTLSLSGLRLLSIYLALGVVLWVAFLLSGVHATVAGVLLALTIPARTRIDADTFIAQVSDELDDFIATGETGSEVRPSGAQREALSELGAVTESVRPPLQRLEDSIEGVVSFVIVPLFALANAGVILAGGLGAPFTWRVFLGTAFGLLIGKPIGIMTASWLALKGGADRPAGTGTRDLFGASLLAGIGFTMSIFIANLAFEWPALLPAAKIGILVASPMAGGAGLFVLWHSSRGSER